METAIHAIALALLAAVAWYFIMLVVGQLRGAVLTSRSADLERTVLQARITQIMDQRRAQQEQHELSWNGFRKFRVIRKTSDSLPRHIFRCASRRLHKPN